MANKIRLRSNEVDGSTAIAHEFDTVNALTSPGAKILSIKNAGTEVFSVDKDGVVKQGAGIVIVRPDEGWQGVVEAMEAVRDAGGGIVQLLAGIYDASQGSVGFAPQLGAGMSGVTLQGIGDATIIDWTGAGSSTVLSISSASSGPSQNKAINNPSNGDTSVFTTTASDAGNYLAGQWLRIDGDDADEPSPIVAQVAEFHRIVANGNPGTGEIQLESPIFRNMTNANISAHEGGVNNHIKDLKFIDNGSGTDSTVLSFTNQIFGSIKRVTIEGGSDLTAGISVSGYHIDIKDCKLRNLDRNAINSGAWVSGECTGNRARNCGNAAGAHDGIFTMQNLYNVAVSNNILSKTDGYGYHHREGSGNHSRQFYVTNNIIRNVTGNTAYDLHEFDDGVIIGNICDESFSTAFDFGATGSAERYTVIGNIAANINESGGGGGFNGQGAIHSTFVGNIVYNSGSDGMSITIGVQSQRDFCVMSGNIINLIYNNEKPGITLGSVSNIACIGNVIQDIQGSVGSVSVGLAITSSTFCSVLGNIIQDVTVANQGLRYSGTMDDNIIAANNYNGEGKLRFGVTSEDGLVEGLNKE